MMFSHWGWGAGSMTNLSACVSITINREFIFQRSAIKGVYEPRGCLAGSGGAITIKMNCVDLLVFVIYLPPEGTENALKTVMALIAWMDNLLSAIGRTVPIIMGDFNTRFGLQSRAVSGFHRMGLT